MRIPWTRLGVLVFAACAILLMSGCGNLKKRTAAPTGTRILSARTPAPGEEYYDVQRGDTLCSIARKFYDAPSAWKKIVEANSDVLKDPKGLRPNMRLIIP